MKVENNYGIIQRPMSGMSIKGDTAMVQMNPL